MRVTACPACSSQAFEVAVGRGAPFDELAGKRTFTQAEYEIRICDRCGLYYKSERLTPSELFEYYCEVDFSKWHPGNLFPPEECILNILRTLPLGSRVLDFGCSDGRLLSELDVNYKRFGFEMNPRAEHIAAERGIAMLSEDEIRGDSDLAFHAIILSDVFEHLMEPTEILQLLRRRLTPGGFLIMFTGDAGAKACQRDVANFWYFRTAQHLCMFSRKHAEYLSRELNLALVGWTEMSHYKLALAQVARQRVQDFAYWQFRKSNSSLLTSLLRITPKLRRAQKWKVPPPITCTSDHVLAVFQS